VATLRYAQTIRRQLTRIGITIALKAYAALIGSYGSAS